MRRLIAGLATLLAAALTPLPALAQSALESVRALRAVHVRVVAASRNAAQLDTAGWLVFLNDVNGRTVLQGLRNGHADEMIALAPELAHAVASLQRSRVLSVQPPTMLASTATERLVGQCGQTTCLPLEVLAQAIGDADRAELVRALETYSTSYELSVDTRTLGAPARALIARIEGVKMWQSLGQPELEARAREEALALAADFDVDITAALALPIRNLLHPANTREGHSIVEVRRRSGNEPVLVEFPEGATRRMKGDHRWFSGYPEAWLDFAYRELPAVLERAHQSHPDVPVLRIWHAGFEDTTQTWLLAGMVDAVIPQMIAQRPDLAPFLQQLRVEIVATDLKNGLGIDEAGAFSVNKAILLPEELGPDQFAYIRDRNQELVPTLAGLTGPARDAALSRLADEGGLSWLFRQTLELTPPVTPIRYNRFHYLPRGWRITDGASERTRLFNPEVTDRTITFELADLTTDAPPTDIDLLVNTEVIPYLVGYGSDNSDALAAYYRMLSGLRPGGTFVTDIHTAGVFKGVKWYDARPFSPADARAALAAADDRGIHFRVTGHERLETIESVTPDPGL